MPNEPTIADHLDAILDLLSVLDRDNETQEIARRVVEIAHRLGCDLPGGEDPWAEGDAEGEDQL